MEQSENVSRGKALLLLLGSFIWGTTFVAQRAGLDYVGPFTFIAVRSLIASAGLFLSRALLRKMGFAQARPQDRKLLFKAGFACGAALFLSTTCQQVGLMTTSAGKAGFITSLYIIIVPVMGLFLRRSVRPQVWIFAGIAVLGLYLMSVREDFSVSRGDFLVLMCAVFFSIHIYLVDHFTSRVDAVALCGTQFLVCGSIAAPVMLLVEQPMASQILSAWLPILYAALLSGGVAYTIQIVCQRQVAPAKASLIMCMESVFALLAGWAVLGERMTPRELTGCALVFFAVLLSALPKQERRHVCKS